VTATPLAITQCAQTRAALLPSPSPRLVEEMNDNIEERINLQKALFEIEDANLYNKHELSQLEEFLEAGACSTGVR
jgi:hypothetical protein